MWTIRARKTLWALLLATAFFAVLEGALRAWGGIVAWRGRARWGDSDGRTLVCAGDSVTYGYPVGPEKGWPAVLSSLPAARGIRILNFGTPGMTLAMLPDQIETYWDAEIPEEAMVIAMIGRNDCNGLDPTGSRGPAESPLRTVRFLQQVVGRARAKPSTGARIDPAACRDRLTSGFDRLERVLAIRDVPLALATYPVGRPSPFDDSNDAISRVVNGLIHAEATRRGLPLVDLGSCLTSSEAGTPPPLGRPPRPSHDPPDELARMGRDEVHPTAEGYAVVARCVADALPALFGG